MVNVDPFLLFSNRHSLQLPIIFSLCCCNSMIHRRSTVKTKLGITVPVNTLNLFLTKVLPQFVQMHPTHRLCINRLHKHIYSKNIEKHRLCQSHDRLQSRVHWIRFFVVLRQSNWVRLALLLAFWLPSGCCQGYKNEHSSHLCFFSISHLLVLQLTKFSFKFLKFWLLFFL